MRRTAWIATLLLCMIVVLSGCTHKASSDENEAVAPFEIEDGATFEPGAYIYVADVQILYDGERFVVTNESNDIARVTYEIVGLKADGTYEMLQTAALAGKDDKKYDGDLSENGWAVSHGTNMARPGESFKAEVSVLDLGGDFVQPDIDGDGYYDLVFRVSPQKDEESVMASTNDPVSGVYKLKAE